jgi:hypothetical protein
MELELVLKMNLPRQPFSESVDNHAVYTFDPY